MTSRGGTGSLDGNLRALRGKVIQVDFSAPRRARVSRQPVPERANLSGAQRDLAQARGYLLFWRPPARRNAAEYLGGRWDWGWTLFVWTSDQAVGPVWSHLEASRGYVPQRLNRDEFVGFLHRATDIGGLLLDGELEERGAVIRAEPHQLIRREDALTALATTPRRLRREE